MAAVVAPAPTAAPECATHPVVASAEPGLTIAEVAERTGVTAHTLRYYERAGLVEVPRDESGHRVYGPTEVGRVVFLSLLRAAAMPIRDLKAYVDLVREGPGNEADRIAILAAHRDRVARSLVELAAAKDLIDLKLDLYRSGDPT